MKPLNIDGFFRRRDSDILLSLECLVQWKESVLHYAWWLLFSSHGAVRHHCRSCSVSTNCSMCSQIAVVVSTLTLSVLVPLYFVLLEFGNGALRTERVH